MQVLINLLPLSPEIFLLFAACVILLAGLFSHNKNTTYFLSQFTLLVAILLTWLLYSYLNVSQHPFMFDHVFVVDKLAIILKITVLIAVFMTFVYSQDYNLERSIAFNEFYVLALLSTIGMLVLISSANLLVLFLGVELFSLPIYAMVALRREKEQCIEAAMKYFIIGAIASGMLLYGMALLFATTQTLDLAAISNAITSTALTQNVIVLFGLVFLMAGLAFKLGAAPFHMWVPDVYDGAPSSVTLFLSTAPKMAAFAMVIRLLLQATPSLVVQWSQMLIVIAIASIVIGNVAAVVQNNIKRMLAYSSIAHMGYMVLGIACGSLKGYAAALFYAISYTIMTLGSFGMVTILSKLGMEADNIEDYAGLSDRNPWLAFVMMMLMFSLAGIPPIIGFIAKVGIIEALVQAHLVWLAIIAVVFSIVGAYYYIRVVKVMYFEAPTNAPVIKYPFAAKIAISLNGIAVLLLGIFPGVLFAICYWAF